MRADDTKASDLANKRKVGEGGEHDLSPGNMLEKLRDIKTPQEGETLSNDSQLARVFMDLQRRYGNANIVRLLKDEKTLEDESELAAQTARYSEGKPLDPQVRQEMEEFLGQDLSHVRVHRDRASEESAEALGAKAYTRGKDIYFGKDLYAPHSPEGKRLLAHELVHVVQQSGGEQEVTRHSPITGSLEKEADQAVQLLEQGIKPDISTRSNISTILKQEKEKKEAAKFKRHGREIIPALKRGVINAGPFSVVFSYEVTEGAGVSSLTLRVPDEVGVSFSSLGEATKGGYRISDPGGTIARSILISMSMGSDRVPKIRALFTKGAFTYEVVFQFAQ